ncbi:MULTISPECIES: chloride channel protein [Sphingobium]|uniref:Chloride channel protein n=1 Tax=Sphingobium baderi LL03 TaxID=1114964 RepID=T0GQC1_9SPHN|nr:MULTISPECIES: chloride channel protein [Sphingobium]AMK26250.1 chloride channel core protein [Sphingobium sp. TKS]EQB02193.1 chloride channel protein [Sphingobium baderi LL03]KMS58985.1 chloride channel protein [Sphingobium baderi LL03]
MQRSWKSVVRPFAIRQRRRLRESEAAFILLAVLAGLAAGLMTNVQQWLAHGLQHLFYGVTVNRLSALGAIHHPWRLLALPVGGAMLVLFALLLKGRKRSPIDVVEANALHGGRIPMTDNLVIATQTVISNGMGASVGLEAAYAQMGGGVASLLGQWLKLRRNDLRTLVGAGAGAAIGAAFGAPLTGAFYAFEIVIGHYTPSAIAPVIAAALAGVFVTRAMGVEPWLIATTADRAITTTDYLLFALLGLLCAVLGIMIMRLVTFAEVQVQGWTRLGRWKPLIGGLLLIPLALASPQTLSAGHGALHLNLVLQPAVALLLLILVLKIAASVISLSFGFRGGLFFASLFLGALAGQIFAGLVNASGTGISLDPGDAALVGMAGLSVSIVGGPMTLALLMLETTRDFGLMAVVLTASLLSSAVTREMFGYSFSTWRLHLRGSSIRSPRDIGWVLNLTAGRMMRRDWVRVEEDCTVAQFRNKVPLGSASKAIMTDAAGHYRGVIPTAAAYAPDLDGDARLAPLAVLRDATLKPDANIQTILPLFDRWAADELAVVGGTGLVMGVLTEKHARRRYFEEIESSQRALFGES